MKFFFKAGLILILSLYSVTSAFGGDADKIKAIHIATPEWDGQTNKDGTGLFFEIVRKVYEPAGIMMTYRFVPWKRAQKMVSSGKADAMLCVWEKHAKENKQRIPKYPMFVEYTGAAFKKDNIKKWKGVPSLTGKRAVWLRGYNYHTSSQMKAIKLKWSEVDRYEQAWGMLEKGRVDVYIDALVDMDHYIKTNTVDMSPYRLEILWGQDAYLAFANTEKSKTLIEIYDKRIIDLFKTGELKNIYKKWDVRYSPDAWDK